MPIIQLIIILAVIGFLLWLVTSYIPMEPLIKRIIIIVVVFAVVLWLLSAFGLLNGLSTIKVHGQTKEEPKVEVCTVDDQNGDRTRTIHCAEFDFQAATWPKEWEEFKSKGDTVRLKAVDGRVIPIPAPCKERIRRRYRALCLTTACARMDIDSALLTPSECLTISAKERIEYTKE